MRLNTSALGAQCLSSNAIGNYVESLRQKLRQKSETQKMFKV